MTLLGGIILPQFMISSSKSADLLVYNLAEQQVICLLSLHASTFCKNDVTQKWRHSKMTSHKNNITKMTSDKNDITQKWHHKRWICLLCQKSWGHLMFCSIFTILSRSYSNFLPIQRSLWVDICLYSTMFNRQISLKEAQVKFNLANFFLNFGVKIWNFDLYSKKINYVKADFWIITPFSEYELYKKGRYIVTSRLTRFWSI